MLLLLQSPVNRPKGGARVIMPPPREIIEDDDDILLATWYLFLRRPYKKGK